MNPSMRKVNNPSVEENAAGPLTGANFKSVDPSVKKILCPALGLPNEVKIEEPVSFGCLVFLIIFKT